MDTFYEQLCAVWKRLSQGDIVIVTSGLDVKVSCSNTLLKHMNTVLATIMVGGL